MSDRGPDLLALQWHAGKFPRGHSLPFHTSFPTGSKHVQDLQAFKLQCLSLSALAGGSLWQWMARLATVVMAELANLEIENKP